MESSRLKAFTQLRAQLSVAAVLVFILLLGPVLFVVGQDEVVRVKNGDTNKGNNNVSA